jgi:hypothetical protein
MLVVLGSGGGAVALFGIERVSSSLRLVFAELSVEMGLPGTDGDGASEPARVEHLPPVETNAPAAAAEPAETGGASSASVGSEAQASAGASAEPEATAPNVDVTDAPSAAASTKPHARPKKRSSAKAPRKSQAREEEPGPDFEQSIFGKRL